MVGIPSPNSMVFPFFPFSATPPWTRPRCWDSTIHVHLASPVSLELHGTLSRETRTRMAGTTGCHSQMDGDDMWWMSPPPIISRLTARDNLDRPRGVFGCPSRVPSRSSVLMGPRTPYALGLNRGNHGCLYSSCGNDGDVAPSLLGAGVIFLITCAILPNRIQPPALIRPHQCHSHSAPTLSFMGGV